MPNKLRIIAAFLLISLPMQDARSFFDQAEPCVCPQFSYMDCGDYSSYYCDHFVMGDPCDTPHDQVSWDGPPSLTPLPRTCDPDMNCIVVNNTQKKLPATKKRWTFEPKFNEAHATVSRTNMRIVQFTYSDTGGAAEVRYAKLMRVIVQPDKPNRSPMTFRVGFEINSLPAVDSAVPIEDLTASLNIQAGDRDNNSGVEKAYHPTVPMGGGETAANVYQIVLGRKSDGT